MRDETAHEWGTQSGGEFMGGPLAACGARICQVCFLAESFVRRGKTFALSLEFPP
jgi:hypothetical protein